MNELFGRRGLNVEQQSNTNREREPEISLAAGDLFNAEDFKGPAASATLGARILSTKKFARKEVCNHLIKDQVL